MRLLRRARGEPSRPRSMRFDAVFMLVASILVAFAPSLEALTCGCGHEGADARSESCCDEDEGASGHDSRTSNSDDPDHPCPNRGDSCCCERAHDAIPAGEVSRVPAPDASFVVPVAIETRFQCLTQIQLHPFGRARCRDSPNVFVLNCLRL